MPDLPFEALFVFALAMLWRATAVTYVTHMAGAVLGLRSRCLSHWLRLLLIQAAPCSLAADARVISGRILRHPMIGSERRPGDFITREQLAVILEELALASPETLQAIDLWFDRAMLRATHQYRRIASILSAIAALAVLAVTDRAAFADPATLLFLWIPLSLGSPFWYDVLRRMVPILRHRAEERRWRSFKQR